MVDDFAATRGQQQILKGINNDPGCSGALVDIGDAFLRPALRTLTQYAHAAGLEAPEVRVSGFGADAVAVGAAALARYRLTRAVAQTHPAAREVAAMEAS